MHITRSVSLCLLLPRITQEAGVTNTAGNVTESISRTNAIINSNWICYYGINGGGFKLPVAKNIVHK